MAKDSCRRYQLSLKANVADKAQRKPEVAAQEIPICVESMRFLSSDRIQSSNFVGLCVGSTYHRHLVSTRTRSARRACTKHLLGYACTLALPIHMYAALGSPAFAKLLHERSGMGSCIRICQV